MSIQHHPPAMKEQLRMKEIAAAAGVSVATVSRALNNHPGIPAETRRHIRAVARRLGYRPNPLVGALMTQIRGRKPSARANLACLHGQPSSPGLGQTQSDFLEGARHAATQLGYHIDFFDAARPESTPGELVRVWRARNVSGVILKNFRPKGEFALPWDEFAWVVSGHNEGLPRLHRVGNEIYQIVSLALRQAHERGYRRPGLALPLQGPDRAGYRWPGAFQGNLMCLGLRLGADCFFRAEWDPEAFGKWVHRYRPDVVLSMLDEPLMWLRRMGVRVPGEAGFIHLAANISSPSTSGVVQDFFRGGEAAVHTLDSELRRNERGIPELPTTFTVSGTWRRGKTIRPVSGRGRGQNAR